jgi:hypothetical protein
LIAHSSYDVPGKKAGIVYEGGEEIFDTYLNHLEKIGIDLDEEEVRLFTFALWLF